MKKSLISILSLSCLLGFVSCGNNTDVTTNNGSSNEPTTNNSVPQSSTNLISQSTSNPTTSNNTSSITSTIVKTYTVTWQNDDNSILEVDYNVVHGTLPSYDGETPTKNSDDDYIYVFKGWSPTISEVISDITYTATYESYSISKGTPGITPIISEDKTSIEYGFYPQSYVNDQTLIEKLNTLNYDTYNWCLYEGNYYLKETANVFNGATSYTFNDGTIIENQKEYWFKCETIKWNILSKNNNTYYLLSSTLLDAHDYYNNYANRTIESKTIYSNNYEYSDIRTWLNKDFYNTAFRFNNSYITSMNIDNSSNTTDNENNKYVCNNTIDKVTLLSYKDYLNSNYGFETNKDQTSKTRECLTTEYTRIKGAWYSESIKFASGYWTRSPSSEYSYCAYNVNSGGYLSSYAIDGSSHCVRPCITITIK